MAQPSVLTTNKVSVSNIYNVNYHCTPVNIGFGVVVTGSVTYSLQHSFDGSTWFNNSVANNIAVNQEGYYIFPVKYIRINQTFGTGSVICTLIQAGLV